MNKFFAIFVLVILSIEPSLAEYTVSYADHEKFQLIEFSGEFMHWESQKELKNVIKQINGKKNIVLKVGSSIGGLQAHFKRFIKIITKTCSEKRGSKCHLTTVFSSDCGSSCTLFPLYSDYSVSLPDAQFGFHRLWVVHPNIVMQTKESFINVYISGGGDPKWFKENIDSLTENQIDGFWMTKNQEIESGLIQEQVNSFDEFVDNYKQIQ